MKRVAAWRSPAFLPVPSCVMMGSGLKGITARWSGWTNAAPTMCWSYVIDPWRWTWWRHAAQCSVLEAKDAVPSSANTEAASRTSRDSRAWPRWSGPQTRLHSGRTDAGETGSRLSRLCVSHGTRSSASIVPTFPAPRCVSNASSDGDGRENRAQAAMSASGKDLSGSLRRYSGMAATPRRSTLHRASAERGWRCLGATSAMVTPDRKTAHRVSEGRIVAEMVTKRPSGEPGVY
jgi:hypothetical protein